LPPPLCILSDVDVVIPDWDPLVGGIQIQPGWSV
jgi:hypothetical protein